MFITRILIICQISPKHGLQLMSKVRIQDVDPIDGDLKKIQLIQNKVIRLLSGKKISDKISTKVMLKDLSMLSINQMNCQIKLMECWKSVNQDGNNVKFQRQMISDDQMNTRARVNENLILGPSIGHVSKTFRTDAVKMWSVAPMSIKNCKSLYLAKKSIRQYVSNLPI